jgi:hypothetical protein
MYQPGPTSPRGILEELASHRSVLAALIAVSLAWASGCNSTWRASSVQPQLTLGHGDLARTSLTNEILMRDMEISRRVFLANSVYFVVVSKDRLRFHVRLVHKWKSIADPSRWRVWLEDETGKRFYPEAIDHPSVTRATRVEIIPHDYYILAFKVGGLEKRNSYPLLTTGNKNVPVWRGDGDYTFYQRDIYKATNKQITLVMSRLGYTYRYSWKFVADPELAEFEERHAAARR